MGFNSKYTGAQVETILDALNGISYDPITHSFVFEGNIIVTGGAAFRALLGDLDVPTIMDAIVVDEENITFDYTTGQPILTISDELKEKLGGLNEDELERYLTYHKYLTESSIKGLNFVDKKYLENYFKNNAVTLDTNQEIEGIKNFLNGIQINNSSIISYDPDTKSFVFDGNLIVTGGGAFRAALGDLDVPTIMDAVTVDEHTIIKEGGILKINPNIDLSGGIKPEELQPYLEPYAKIDDVANTYATIVDLSVLNLRINDFLSGSDTDTIINKWKELEVFLSGLSESDNLSTLLSNKANKSTTLAGYGITDAYTKTQIDTSVSAINKTITDLRTYTDNTFVKLDLAQDIKVRHNFTDGLKIGGLSAYKSQDDVVFIDASVVVRGGITAWGNNSQTAPTIWDGLPIDNVTIKRDASGLFYAEVQGNEGINEDQLADYLTTNGYATQSWVTGRGYITSSGSITGNAATANRLIEEVVTNLNNATPGRIFTMTSGYGSTAGNKPTTGWVTGLTLQFAQNGVYRRQLAYGDDFFVRDENNGSWGDWRKILTSTNFYDYALSKDGTASAAWKLANARYLWGQLFDGTSNIGGQMSFNAGNFILAHNATDAWTDGNGLTHPWYGIDFRAGGSYKGYISHWSGISLVSGNDITLASDKNVVVSNGKFHINQSAFSNGLTLNRTSANEGAGIVFQSNGNLLGQIGINGTKTFEVSDGTTIKASIEITTGNILATGGVTATNSSDERLKRNLRKFNASKVLMSLGGVWEYEYIDGEVQKNHIYEGTHYGLIYQNVKGTNLDVMCHEREDGMGALNYIHPKFISLIAGATMENISEVEKLKSKIRTLEAKVKQLENRA